MLSHFLVDLRWGRRVEDFTIFPFESITPTVVPSVASNAALVASASAPAMYIHRLLVALKLSQPIASCRRCFHFNNATGADDIRSLAPVVVHAISPGESSGRLIVFRRHLLPPLWIVLVSVVPDRAGSKTRGLQGGPKIDRRWQRSMLGPASPPSLQHLEHPVLRVPVELDIHLRPHIVFELHQLPPRPNWHQQHGRLLVHR